MHSSEILFYCFNCSKVKTWFAGGYIQTNSAALFFFKVRPPKCNFQRYFLVSFFLGRSISTLNVRQDSVSIVTRQLFTETPWVYISKTVSSNYFSNKYNWLRYWALLLVCHLHFLQCTDVTYRNHHTESPTSGFF